MWQEGSVKGKANWTEFDVFLIFKWFYWHSILLPCSTTWLKDISWNWILNQKNWCCFNSFKFAFRFRLLRTYDHDSKNVLELHLHTGDIVPQGEVATENIPCKSSVSIRLLCQAWSTALSGSEGCAKCISACGTDIVLKAQASINSKMIVLSSGWDAHFMKWSDPWLNSHGFNAGNSNSSPWCFIWSWRVWHVRPRILKLNPIMNSI